jgi:hypothetical protein
MSDPTTTTTPPLTHAQRGALGGAASRPTKGFGTPDVIARAVATRRRKAEARLAEAAERHARVQSITDQYHPPAAAAEHIHVDTVLVRVPAPEAYDVPIIE